MREIKNESKLAICILAAILAGASLLYISALAPRSFGFYHDDGIYVTTAKSLATGQGYRIISLPYEPAQTKYPPFYPFLLSLVWRLYPHFPDNLPAMMMLSVLATLASLALSWLYLTKYGYASQWQALIVVGLFAINWQTVILATGIYSEMLYTLLAFGALYLAERYEKEAKGWILGISLGVVMGLAFLTRTPGIALLFAVAAYYILSKQIRRAVLPLAVASLFVVVWVGWSTYNRTAVEGVNVVYYTSYIRDFADIISDVKAQSNMSLPEIFLKLVGKNTLMLIVISIPRVCLGIPTDLLQGLDPYSRFIAFSLVLSAFVCALTGFIRQRAAGFRLLHYYVISYLSLHLLWPYAIYDRFLLPLLPVLLLFTTLEFAALSRLARQESMAKPAFRKISAGFMVAILIALSGTAVYGYGIGISRFFHASNDERVNQVLDEAETIRWIKENTDPSDILVCYRDPAYYLYTGRKAVRSSSREMGKLQNQQGDKLAGTEVILRIVDQHKACYLISASSDFAMESNRDIYKKAYELMIEENPNVFVPVFTSAHGYSTIYRIHERAGQEQQAQN